MNDLGPLQFDYLNFYNDQSSPVKELLILSYFIFVLALIYLLGSTSSSYFSPSLSLICDKLRLPHNIAGVTFLAFGNGAPDVFSSITSFSGGKQALIGVGELLGGTIFITTIVVGVIICLSPATITVTPTFFLRDISFLLIASLLLTTSAGIMTITLLFPISMLISYLTYVIIVMRSWKESETVDVLKPNQEALLDQSETDSETDASAITTGHVAYWFPSRHQSQPLNNASTRKHISNDASSLEDGDGLEYVDFRNIVTTVPLTATTSTDHRRSSAVTGGVPTKGTSTRIQYEFLTTHEDFDSSRINIPSALSSKPSRSQSIVKPDFHADILDSYIPLSGPSTHPFPQEQRVVGGDEEGGRGDSAGELLSANKRTSTLSSLSLLKPFRLFYIDRNKEINANDDIDGNNQYPDDINDILSPSPPSLSPSSSDSRKRLPSLQLRDERKYFWKKWYLHQKLIQKLIHKNLSVLACSSNLLIIFEFPLIVLRDLTIPTTTRELWNQFIAVGYPIFCPQLLLFVFQIHDYRYYNLQLRVLTLLPSALISAIWYFFGKTHRPPRDQSFMSIVLVLVAFVMCVCWIFLLASELVTCLDAIGKILEIPASILGLTILAWGNCVGDFFSDISLARGGYVMMALAGCYAGPVFNLMVGLGVSLTYACARIYPKPFDLVFDMSTTVSLVTVYIVIISSIIIVPAQGFQMSKGFGYYLIGLYICYNIVQVIVLCN